MKKIILFLFLTSICFGDIEIAEDARWYNSGRDFFFSISASESMTESIGYIFPPDGGSGGQALLTDGGDPVATMTWGIPTTSAEHDLGSTTHDATTFGATRGSLIVGNATPKWEELAISSTIGSPLTKILGTDGTDTDFRTLANFALDIDSILDHGNFAGLDDPDHNASYYTKDEVNDLVEGNTFDFFLNNTNSDISSPTQYFVMDPTETGDAESTFSDTITGDDFLIDTWATSTSEPTFSALVSGIYAFHIHAETTTGAQVGSVRLYWELYSRTHPGGTETLLITSEESDILTGTETEYDPHGTLSTDVVLDVTDRLVLKVYANIETSRPTDPLVTLTAEGTTAAHFEVVTTITAFDDRYVFVTGDTMTGPLTMGTNDILGVDNLTMTGTLTIGTSTIVENGGGDLVITPAGGEVQIEGDLEVSATMRVDTIEFDPGGDSKIFFDDPHLVANVGGGNFKIIIGNLDLDENDIINVTNFTMDGTFTDGVMSISGGNLTSVGTIGASGDADLLSLASGALTVNGTIGSGAITSTGTVQAEQLTSTDDITMQGHLLTMGDAGAATDTVLSFLGSTNSTTITYDESANRFDFGGSAISSGHIAIGQVPSGADELVVRNDAGTANIRIQSNSGSQVDSRVWSSSNPTHSPQWISRRARGTSSSASAVEDNDRIGTFTFIGHDGTAGVTSVGGAALIVNVDGSVASDSVPMEFVFEVLPEGVELTKITAMKIRSSGMIEVSTGKILLINLPDSDPSVTGQLYRIGADIKISL